MVQRASGVMMGQAQMWTRAPVKHVQPAPPAVMAHAAHVMHLFATIVPSAKQQTFAAHNLADTVLLSFADQPLSLANAFETPVQADRRDGGFRLPSTLALIDHYKKLSQAYGLAADSRLFTLLGAESEMDTVVSINELAQWITAQE